MAPQRRLSVTGALVAAVVWTIVLGVYFEYSWMQRLEKVTLNFKTELEGMRQANAELAEQIAASSQPKREQLELQAARLQERAEPPVEDRAEQHVEDAPARTPSRRLNLRTAVAAASNSATSGCVTVSASTTFKMQTTTSNGCNSLRCPPCFFVTANTATLSVQGCSSALVGSSAMSSSQVLEIIFINGGTGVVTVTPQDTSGSAVGNSYTLASYEYVTAYCYGGGSHRMYFPDQSSTSGYCPAGCDATAPSNRAASAFTRRLVSTDSVATELEIIGGITSAGTIAGYVFANSPGGDITWGVNGAQTAGFSSAVAIQLTTIGGISSAGTIASNVFASNPGGSITWSGCTSGGTVTCT